MEPRNEPSFRATFTLPATLARQISHIAKRMRVSQSALLTQLLLEPVDAMTQVLDQLPEVATESDAARARGTSAELIRRAVAEAQDLVNELDP
jgi:hypothetical protein